LAAPRQVAYEKYLGAAQPVQSGLKVVDVCTTKSAYIGLNPEVEGQSVIRLEELTGPDSKWKFKLQKWDGK